MSVSSTVDTVKIADRIMALFDSEGQIAQDMLTWSPSHRGQDEDDALINMLADAEVYRVWKREGRQCLSVHPGLAEEVTLASSDVLYPEIFHAVPYMNPLFVFPDGNSFPGFREGEHARLIGFMCYAMIHNKVSGSTVEEIRDAYHRVITTTSDGDAETIGILSIIEVLDNSGEVVDTEVNRFTITTDKRRTLSETVTDVMQRFKWYTAEGDPYNGTKRRAYMRRIVSASIGALLYACSITLDSEQVPPVAVKRISSRKQSKKHPIRLFRVGWTVGAALELHKARQAAQRINPSEQLDLGHQQDPQHRKAHFKRVWTGKGRNVPKMAFVSAYWTHREALTAEGVNTVRRMR